ncbi:S-adenosylmethionine decarboxylase proenzyme, prokaryotic class 1B [hydrothermal vent metagenome]|uniref:S-adenosylmethionine decarboxylase proenzyme, prokaryotic class 1B n=1 Tax=hydrothermal vent metagenome TaxID=652676 RepID=A0A3B1DP98_9ZZZZ
MDEMKKKFGQQYLVELIGCQAKKLEQVEDVRKVLMEAAKKSKAKVIKEFFHQFEPRGVTGIILIAESHFSIHTWPEDSYAAFDVLTCGEMDAQAAIEVLKKNFQAQRINVRVMDRGIIQEENEGSK